MFRGFWVLSILFLWWAKESMGSRSPLTHQVPIPSVSLVGGNEDLANQFKSVFTYSIDDNELSGRCTGTKVAPNHFLTAAHCFILQESDEISVWPKSHKTPVIFYSFQQKVENVKRVKTVKVTEVVFHPALQQCFTQDKSERESCIENTPDLAWVEIEKSREFDEAPLVPLDLNRVTEGEYLTVVGYGYQQAEDLTPPARKYHLSQVAPPETLKKLYMDSSEDEDSVSDELYFGTLGYLLGPQYASLGAGDSGGPVFRSIEGVSYVVGVNSFSFCPDSPSQCEVTSNSFFARIHRGGEFQIGEWLEALSPSSFR